MSMMPSFPEMDPMDMQAMLFGIARPPAQKPTMAPLPGAFGMSPQTSDAIASGLFSGLQGLGPINPRLGQGEQFAQAFLRSALGAWAIPRVENQRSRMDERQRMNEANLKASEDYRRQIGEAGKQLREHRYKLAEERAKAEAKPAVSAFPTPPELMRIGYPSQMPADEADKAMRMMFPGRFRAPSSTTQILPGGLSKYQVSGIGGLRDDIRLDPDIKDFVTVRDNYKRIQTGAQSKTGLGDLSVIFAYMKVLDPTSVVRETEYKNASEAIGKIPLLANTPVNWIRGNKLTDEGRRGFMDAAQELYDAKRSDYDRAVAFYVEQARALGLDPKLVIRDYTAAPVKAGAGGDWFDQNAPGVK